MSKNINRAKLKKAFSSKQFLMINLNSFYPLYWDEGWNYRKGKGKNWMLPYKCRMYRTWKYNRKTQWK